MASYGDKSGDQSGERSGTWRPAAGGALPWDDAGNGGARELRASVAGCLRALARRIEEALPEALASAARAWDRVDNLLTLLDAPLTAQVGRVWRQLDAVASADGTAPDARAVAVEGLLAIHTAYELTRLHERKLSSLIRLRVRSGSDDLLPGGRPFLDVAAALEEAANAWT